MPVPMMALAPDKAVSMVGFFPCDSTVKPLGKTSLP